MNVVPVHRHANLDETTRERLIKFAENYRQLGFDVSEFLQSRFTADASPNSQECQVFVNCIISVLTSNSNAPVNTYTKLIAISRMNQQLQKCNTNNEANRCTGGNTGRAGRQLIDRVAELAAEAGRMDHTVAWVTVHWLECILVAIMITVVAYMYGPIDKSALVERIKQDGGLADNLKLRESAKTKTSYVDSVRSDGSFACVQTTPKGLNIIPSCPPGESIPSFVPKNVLTEDKPYTTYMAMDDTFHQIRPTNDQALLSKISRDVRNHMWRQHNETMAFDIHAAPRYGTPAHLRYHASHVTHSGFLGGEDNFMKATRETVPKLLGDYFDRLPPGEVPEASRQILGRTVSSSSDVPRLLMEPLDPVPGGTPSLLMIGHHDSEGNSARDLDLSSQMTERDYHNQLSKTLQTSFKTQNLQQMNATGSAYFNMMRQFETGIAEQFINAFQEIDAGLKAAQLTKLALDMHAAGDFDICMSEFRQIAEGLGYTEITSACRIDDSVRMVTAGLQEFTSQMAIRVGLGVSGVYLLKKDYNVAGLSFLALLVWSCCGYVRPVMSGATAVTGIGSTTWNYASGSR